MSVTAILDVDGTLVDSNYFHAIAWYRAFRQLDVVIPTWRIHRHIGMGGDQMVPALAGEGFEEERGEEVREVETERYRELIDEVEVLPGAQAFIERLKEMGHTVVLASSSKEEELDRYLELLGARELADGWTTSADVEATKPDPDLVRAALDRAGDADAEAVMVGDSTFDCEAAGRADVGSIGVLTGGFSSAELRESGAAAVYESVEELVRRIDETPFGAQVSA
ncbi:MAG: HAD family hydrolase [Thermoleophilaceae bacterium]|nr:HAD family hydrolase [Thermoleophilaceae bacterium]